MAEDKAKKRPAKKRPKTKTASNGRGGSQGGGGGRGGGKDNPPQGPTQGGDGDPAKIHEDYVKRHFEGGAEPTPEAYERARRDFEKLPGAVRSPGSLDRSGEEKQAEPNDDNDGNKSDKPS